MEDDCLEADEEIQESLINLYQIKTEQPVFGKEDSTNSFSDFSNSTSATLNDILLTITDPVSSQYYQRELIDHRTYTLATSGKSFISLKERVSISDWMAQFCSRYKLSRQSYSLALMYFDRVVNKICTTEKAYKNQQRLEGISAACLFIATKFEETRPPRLFHLQQCVFTTNSTQQLLELERKVLQDLDWNLSSCSHYQLMQLVILHWPKIIDLFNSQENSLDNLLECSEQIFDDLVQNKLYYLLEVVRLDLRSSCFVPLHLVLSLFYLFNVSQILPLAKLSDLASVTSLELLNDESMQFNMKFSALLDKLVPSASQITTANERSPPSSSLLQDLAPTINYLRSFSQLFDKLNSADVLQQFCHRDESGRFNHMTVFYSQYLKPEIVAVILKNQQQQQPTQTLPSKTGTGRFSIST